MTNTEIAKILEEISEYLDVSNDGFRSRAYGRAAATIASLDREATDIYREEGQKGLESIPSIGSGIAEKIEELVTTGSLHYLDELKTKLPVNVQELTAIEGVGPKTIKTLYTQLHIKTRDDLEKAAASGSLRALPHFGEKTERKILKSIEFLKQSKGRFLLGDILPIASKIEVRLKKIPGVRHVAIAGSLRRRQETIGDIDIVASSKEPQKMIDAFISFPEVVHIYGSGATKANVRLSLGIDADLRVVHDKEYGAALLYFTGDKQHNIELRKIAIEKGWKLSEYGLFKGNKLLAGATEEEVYHKLGLEWMPPEIRTVSGEIEAAMEKRIPRLIPYGSIKGDLQVQTSWTDGTASIEAMTDAALAHGLSYIAITDHTKSLTVARGLDEKGLARQAREIDALNKKFLKKKFRILKSAEVNILKDGKLDIADTALKKLDLVGVSVHSHFGMSEEEMTARIITALKHPLVNILFHPTGRLIKKREPYKVDILKVIKAAKHYGVALEVNAYPDRLDLKDTHIRLAIEHGVKLVVDTDAHAPEHGKFLDLGVAQVRRGWGSKTDVLNTQSVSDLLKEIKRIKNSARRMPTGTEC
ncbi:DNA polymerase/3'-5' exonuclease PolX [Candidatus Uhrbacteria bacterium]|nr:DNA polymerase/3'-5' exonuclease PolX [Candidatus Uhrbacteria bacterium]